MLAMQNIIVAQSTVKEKYQLIQGHLNEKSRRIWAATEAKAIGRGGLKIVHEATGLSYATIKNGMSDLTESNLKLMGSEPTRIRKKGGGRKKTIVKDSLLKQDIEMLVESATRGDPESTLRWCSKSTRKIAHEINQLPNRSHRVSHALIARELDEQGYSLQANRKVNEGGKHPDRDEQFNFINSKVKDFQAKEQPVISVDTKKKENIGNFKNAGQEYYKKGSSPKVNVHDFIDKEKGKAAPYGIYDLSKNKGWVSVGISSDTAEFAVNSIRSWWYEMGQEAYPNATRIYINADGGGSNGSRVRLWKIELQKLASEINKVIEVSHLPPGTSKWNKIEHKMFCFITKNWRGTPLIDTATIVNLISNTTTKTGLKIKSKLDTTTYKKGIIISDEELEKINMVKDIFHGEWNYKISPKN